MWNFRMLAMTGDARYTDVLERTLYNGANAGMSLSGTLYCYRNPLSSAGEKLRNPWYDVTCCPPNVERLFESLPGYLYAISRDGVYVNLYQTSEVNWRLEDGTAFKINQITDYPWSGAVRLQVSPEKPSDFTLYVRWPGWSPSLSVDVNGSPLATGDNHSGSYLPILRRWEPGDTVNINLPLVPALMAANPRVADEYGRVAIQRGPLVYALEQTDQNGAAVSDLFFRLGSPISSEARKDLLGGVALLKSSGQVAEKPLPEEPLYQSFGTSAVRAKRPATLTFVPYYAVGNRDPGPMEVWVPLSRTDPAGAAVAGNTLERHPEPR
jgi:DUF1680 family protein